MKASGDERQTLTVQEAARIIGISRERAAQYIRNGKIPALKLGKRFFVPRAALERWLRTAGSNPDQ